MKLYVSETQYQLVNKEIYFAQKQNQEFNMKLTALENAPSKTGNPSGKGRGNNPPRK